VNFDCSCKLVQFYVSNCEIKVLKQDWKSSGTRSNFERAKYCTHEASFTSSQVSVTSKAKIMEGKGVSKSTWQAAGHHSQTGLEVSGMGWRASWE